MKKHHRFEVIFEVRSVAAFCMWLYVVRPVHTILPLLKIRSVALESLVTGIFAIAPGNCSGSYIMWICFSSLRSLISFSMPIGFCRSIVATMFWILAFGFVWRLMPAFWTSERRA